MFGNCLTILLEYKSSGEVADRDLLAEDSTVRPTCRLSRAAGADAARPPKHEHARCSDPTIRRVRQLRRLLGFNDDHGQPRRRRRPQHHSVRHAWAEWADAPLLCERTVLMVCPR